MVTVERAHKTFTEIVQQAHFSSIRHKTLRLVYRVQRINLANSNIPRRELERLVVGEKDAIGQIGATSLILCFVVFLPLHFA